MTLLDPLEFELFYCVNKSLFKKNRLKGNLLMIYERKSLAQPFNINLVIYNISRIFPTTCLFQPPIV